MRILQPQFKTFSEFYLFYLAEHKGRACRRLHFIGSALVLILLIYIFLTGSWALLPVVPITGYGFSWVGHFLFEKNRPATFKYPLWSFMGDWVMFKDMLIGKVSW